MIFIQFEVTAFEPAASETAILSHFHTSRPLSHLGKGQGSVLTVLIFYKKKNNDSPPSSASFFLDKVLKKWLRKTEDTK